MVGYIEVPGCLSLSPETDLRANIDVTEDILQLFSYDLTAVSCL